MARIKIPNFNHSSAEKNLLLLILTQTPMSLLSYSSFLSRRPPPSKSIRKNKMIEKENWGYRDRACLCPAPRAHALPPCPWSSSIHRSIQSAPYHPTFSTCLSVCLSVLSITPSQCVARGHVLCLHPRLFCFSCSVFLIPYHMTSSHAASLTSPSRHRSPDPVRCPYPLASCP